MGIGIGKSIEAVSSEAIIKCVGIGIGKSIEAVSSEHGREGTSFVPMIWPGGQGGKNDRAPGLVFTDESRQFADVFGYDGFL